MSQYIISHWPGPDLVVEIEDPPPCLFCGEPVDSPSSDGPLVCAWCDLGMRRDGAKWTQEEAEQAWEHRRHAIGLLKG
jgi:hypothetical protein